MKIQSKTTLCGSLAIVLAAGLIAAPTGAFAQAIERNLPPAPQPAPPLIAGANLIPADQDATPIGAVLKGVVILGANDPVLANPTTAGVDLGGAAQLKGDAGHLAGFLGKPISRKLIAQIEAEIANQYRRAGFPFVNLATPPQEITSGVLQIRVVEFRLAQKTAPGANAHDAIYIESQVRATPGQPIDTNLLAQDLDWLNRFPFRKTEAVFTPATLPGGTDLALQTTASKPWSAYVGYSDSGSPLTGMDRYFAGFQALLPGSRDALISYQFTGSGDALFDGGRLFDSASDPTYVSHAGRLIIPTLARQDIEASVSYVQSNTPAQAFLVRQTTYEGTLAYRSALSNLSSGLPGEGVIGVEVKRQTSATLFDGATETTAAFDVFQATLGYAQQETDAWGRTAGDITAHISPGSVNDQNTAAAFSRFSQGRFDETRYAYLSFDLNRYTLLPPVFGVDGFSLSNTLIGQYSAVALPLTEQIGLGNNSLVRGYTLDDGAFDAGVISRNELRAPGFALLGRTGRVVDQLSAYIFLDAGYGKDHSHKTDDTAISTGLGADYQLTTHLTATFDGAWALRNAGYTRSGDARLESRVVLSF